MSEKFKRHAIGGFGLVLLGIAVLCAAMRFPVLPGSSPSADAPPQLVQAAPDAAPGVMKRVRSTSSGKAAVESKIGRAEYFFRMLRDPATNAMPPNYRSRELAYAKTLPSYDELAISATGNSVGNQASTGGSQWREVGPTDVGGRTRALAVDVRDPDIIMAGGVSGGVWRSTDGGQTWVLKTGMDVPLSVTWIAQDPRSGYQDTWYYTTGEFSGNSASDLEYHARFFGSGIYKSTDNGDSWKHLGSTADTDTASWDSPFDYASKIVVHPDNGYLYVAANGVGIYRSEDGGDSFELVLGERWAHAWADVAISAPSGGDYTLLATLSTTNSGILSGEPGFYMSTDDGDSWSRYTGVMPVDHDRSVIAPVPSQQKAYIFTYEGSQSLAGEEKIALTFVDFQDMSTLTYYIRDDNLPAIGSNGIVNTQGSYNMAMAVKPGDEEFVLFGGTNLFRSKRGVTTPMNDADSHWVGGYTNMINPNTGDYDSYRLYENQHPDQHVLVFDPADPNVLWAGHDGGISRTRAVRAVPMVWESMNNGYNVTQFYTVAMSPLPGATEVLGGTQDNGTPFFDWQKPLAGSRDISSGDGAFAYFGSSYIYVSTQLGRIVRVNPDGDYDAFILDCQGIGGNCLFIHPYVVDPTGESIMYVPIFQRELWRAKDIDRTPAPSWGDSSWDRIASLASGSIISTLAVSQSDPSHRLYFAGYGGENTAPSLVRLDSANTAVAGEFDISITSTPQGDTPPQGAWVQNIAVNPEDADEILVVMSNYNIIGLYHSSDGGSTYTAVEGNLAGGINNPGLGGTDNPGPSLRWAAIVPPVGIYENLETKYYVATSIGLFSATRLEGSDTDWVQEGKEVLGNVVVAALAARPSDTAVVAATHGRGIFTARVFNNQPQADAGDDRTVFEGNLVQLDGSGSSDGDTNDSLTYHWTQIDGLWVSLQDTTDDRPRFTAPSVEADRLLKFSLVVNDGWAASEQDTVEITVKRVDSSSGGGGCALTPGSTSNAELLVLFIGVLAYLGLRRRGRAWVFGYRR